MTDVQVIDDAALLAQLTTPEPHPVNTGDDGRWGEATPETRPETDTSDVGTDHPRNATTGEPYKGGNVPRLLAASIEHGYHGPEWAGFQQWIKAGRVARKGEHGTHCRTVIQVTDKKGRPGTTCRGFTVFHRDQTDELTTA